MLFAGGKNMFKVNNKNVLNYWIINVLNVFLVDPFHATDLFLYSLKTPENQRFSDVSRGTERDKWHEMGNNKELK